MTAAAAAADESRGRGETSHLLPMRERRTRRCTKTDGDNAPINHDGKNSAEALVDDRRRLESCASTTWASARICRHLVSGAAPPMVMAAVIANESQSLYSTMMPPATSIVVTSWSSRSWLPSPPSTLSMRSFCGGKRQVPSDSCLPPSRSPGRGSTRPLSIRSRPPRDEGVVH